MRVLKIVLLHLLVILLLINSIIVEDVYAQNGSKYSVEELIYENGTIISKKIKQKNKNDFMDFDTLEQAEKEMYRLPQKDGKEHKNYVIKHSSSNSPQKIVSTNLGFAITWKSREESYVDNIPKVVNTYDQYGGNLTYLSARRMMKYFGTKNIGGTVYFKIMNSGSTGYVKASEADIVPYLYVYHEVEFEHGNGVKRVFRPPMYSARTNNGVKELRFQDEDYLGYNSIGVAPNFMVDQADYYSFDGIYFYTDLAMKELANKEPYYNYYQYLPYTSKSKVTAKVLDEYTEQRVSGRKSAMLGLGSAFVKNQELTDSNALLTYSLAVLESATGTSYLALNKNNLFGWNAVDSNPIGGASSYDSLDLVVNKQMGENLKLYVNIFNWRFAGAFFGNKGAGFNLRYASDPYWGQKVAGIAFEVDRSMNFADYNAYQLGILETGNDIDIKSAPSNSSATLHSRISTDDEEISPLIIKGLSKGLINQSVIIKKNPEAEKSGFYQVYLYYPELMGKDWDKDFGYIEKEYVKIVNNGQNYIPPNFEIPTEEPLDSENENIEKFIVEADGGLNIREKQTTLSSRLGLIRDGASVEGVKTKSGWVKIKYDNFTDYKNGKKIGYVHGDFLVKIKEDIRQGDINADGEIDIKDYSEIAYHLLEKKLLNGEELRRADIDKDGKITLNDYISVAQHIIGKRIIR